MRYLFGFVIALAALAFAACGGDGGECAEPAADIFPRRGNEGKISPVIDEGKIFNRCMGVPHARRDNDGVAG